MKKILYGMLFVSALMGCSSDEEDFAEPVNTPKEYIVSLGFSGKITDISESPFTRAGSDNDLYGIQVYSAPVSSTDESDYKAYAYGLFDTKVGITLKLLEGYKYRFVSTMIVDGKSKLYYDRYSKCYYYPFALYNDNESRCLSVTDRFIVSAYRFQLLGYGFADIKDIDGSMKSSNSSNVDRYYGEAVDYIPSENGIFLLI